MPWRCPACQTPIRHDGDLVVPALPVPSTIYRCHVCRLELILDPTTNKLVLAPLPERTA